jgi:fimbrial isopeptide formation D2 family protein
MFSGQSHTITITATVNGGSGQTIQNTATASATNAPTVSDNALVYLNGGVVAGASTSFTYSKSAFNDTKNVDATTVPADKEDFITYTLTATNTGNTTATNFVVSDDLTNVLNYASMVSLNGGTLNGNTISWPAVTIAQNTSVQETFKVRVNYSLPTSYNNLQLVNTYGNTVTIQINNPKVLGASITAPTTGPASEAAYAIGFATLLTAAFYGVRKVLAARKTT